MNHHSTDHLRLLGQRPGRYLLLERKAPRGRLKGDVVSLKEGEGRDVVDTAPDGSRWIPTVPVETLNDLLRARLVAVDGPDDGGAEVIFRLTEEGQRRAQFGAEVRATIAEGVGFGGQSTK